MELRVEDRLSVTVRGLTPEACRKQAACACDRALGDHCWRFEQQDVRPCLVTLGGRPRLWEGRFVAASAQQPS